MKHIFFTLLLVILPIQHAWSISGLYCQHEQEQEQSSQHFGHHEHQHVTHDGQEKSESGKASQTADNDCSLHLHGLEYFLRDQMAPIYRCVQFLAAALQVRYSSHIPPGLERPDRRRAI